MLESQNNNEMHFPIGLCLNLIKFKNLCGNFFLLKFKI